MKNPFPWLTIGICSLLLIPALFMDGMFLDGVFYAAISKNYATGFGTFWNPYYSATVFPSMHEQPPLMFFLQGLFFKVLGVGLYTERIYCLLTAIISVLLICRCWKIIAPASKTQWLPVLFWFTMPVTFYIFINNLEECTMGIFVLAAMIHLLRAMHLKQRETMHLVLAGGMLLLAGLTKGIQGMFLLGAPFCWWICTRDTGFKVMIRRSFFVVLLPALFVLYAWLTPVVHKSFSAYFNARIIGTFSHRNDTSDSHFHILYELLLDSLPLLVMTAIVLFASRKNIALLTGWNQQKKLILFFALSSATGIFPLMITMEQRGFYLVPALPFLALAFSLLIAPQIDFMMEKLNRRKKLTALIESFGIFLTAGALISTLFLYGKPKRDSNRIHDLYVIFSYTGYQTTALLSEKTKYEWSLYAYAMRNHDVSFLQNKWIPSLWLLQDKSEPIPAGYQWVPLSTQQYYLFKKRP
ncbi:hypothetical protein BH11BAC7_BH11BAC7_06690 [soil metagenome]